MKKEYLRKDTKMERITNCIISVLYSGLVSFMIVVASVSLLIGQPFVNGFILLISAILLAAIALRYREIELFWKSCKLRLKR